MSNTLNVCTCTSHDSWWNLLNEGKPCPMCGKIVQTLKTKKDYRLPIDLFQQLAILQSEVSEVSRTILTNHYGVSSSEPINLALNDTILICQKMLENLERYQYNVNMES